MLEEFDNYVSNYDMNNEDIRAKYNHIHRVMKLNEKYAKILGFSEYDIKLASVIGLLHDIGRFEQLKIYNSYDDKKTIDHADFGAKLLFDDNLIKKFWKNEDDYEIIKNAIKYHNKIKVPDIDDERMLKHINLIRDTDKIDIIYLLGYLGELNIKATSDQISKDIVDETFNHRTVNYELIKNPNDKIAVQFAYVFDMYNDICLSEYKKNLHYYYKQIDGEDIFKDIYNEIIKYIDERMIKKC